MRPLTIAQPNLGDLSLENFLCSIRLDPSEGTSSKLAINGPSRQESVYENWSFLAIPILWNEDPTRSNSDQQTDVFVPLIEGHG